MSKNNRKRSRSQAEATATENASKKIKQTTTEGASEGHKKEMVCFTEPTADVSNSAKDSIENESESYQQLLEDEEEEDDSSSNEAPGVANEKAENSGQADDNGSAFNDQPNSVGDEVKDAWKFSAKSKEIEAATGTFLTAAVGHVETVLSTSEKQILTSQLFSSLDICDKLKNALTKDMGFNQMTAIQGAAIPHLLAGKDVLGAAKTGSGKTLAFLVPALDLLYKLKVSSNRGTVVLILTPTRELALQIFSVAQEAGQYMTQTKGAIMGGCNMKSEAKKLIKGVNLLVATPGRLLDHLKNTQDFVYRNLQFLVLDEADRMLDVGFRQELTEILAKLPKKRQTALFSATQSAAVNDLIRLSMSPGAVNIRVEAAQPTVNGVTQGYIFCQGHERLAILARLIKKKMDKGEKVMVFFSSCASVEFHHDLFNFLGLKCESIYGKKKQEQRTAVYNRFCTAKDGVLLCTSVAARGLDFPKVDWIIQYDPPDDVTEYIHRIGRTGRGVGGTGAGLLFLLPEEVGFIKRLVAAGATPKEFEVRKKSLSKNYEAIASVVRKNFHLSKSSRDAYKGYILAYKSHALKDVFDINRLDISEVAKSFGLEVPPRVEILGSRSGAPPAKKRQRRR